MDESVFNNPKTRTWCLMRARYSKGINQSETCIKTGLHPSTVSRLEWGIIKGNRSHWQKIACVLMGRLEDLFPKVNDGRS